MLCVLTRKWKLGFWAVWQSVWKTNSRRRKIVDLVEGLIYKDLPNLLAEVEEGWRHQCNFVERRNLWRYFTGSLDEQWHYCFSFHHARLWQYVYVLCGPYPWTRGSREPQSIMKEIQDLWDKGFKEITLLGQNVDSYLCVWRVEKRFHNCFWNTKATAVDFDQLLEMTV
jgi:tRNA-2-methylthio-N6-dimethylallyladenosine synthase